MSKMISASVMCCDFLELGKEIKALEDAKCDMFHIDIMDGNFVDNFAMSIDQIKAIRKITDLPLDVHLMVKEPIRYIKEFKKAGADILTVHLEACTHIHRTLAAIKESDLKAGVAINPGTAHYLLEPIIDDADMILIMSVNPGFAGQKFIPNSVEKVKKVREMIDKKHIKLNIQVDGAISTKTIPPLYEAGANIFVAGTSGLFYGEKNYKKNINKLKNC